MIDIENNLTKLLKHSDALPFLFVGSGISRRYLNLPNWADLLDMFSDKSEYYIQKYNEDYPKVATLIEEEFFDTFWTDAKYKNMKESYLKTGAKGQKYPLKYAIAEYFRQIDYDNYLLSNEVEELKKANIDGFITTNYDNFLETLFDFKVYTGQDEMLFTKILEIAEIYKIHGSCDKFESIVITDNDYEKFKEKNIYLTSKLTSIFIEHPIIFLGYSLSDSNITGILKNIASSIGQDNLNKLKDRIIFVEYEVDKSKHLFEISSKTIDDLIIPITLIKTDDFLSIYKALSKTQRKIPARCLRMLEQQMYELVVTDKLEGRAVVNIENIKDYKDIEFFAGVGVVSEVSNKGYNCIESIDLFEDLVFDEGNYKFPENIINKTLPKLFQKAPQLKIIPIFKYLNESDITKDNFNEFKLHKNIIEVIEQDTNFYNITLTFFKEDAVFITNVFSHLENNNLKEIDLDRFQSFLTLNKALLKDKSNQTANGYYKKLACLYDRLKYGWFDKEEKKV